MWVRFFGAAWLENVCFLELQLWAPTLWPWRAATEVRVGPVDGKKIILFAPSNPASRRHTRWLLFEAFLAEMAHLRCQWISGANGAEIWANDLKSAIFDQKSSKTSHLVCQRDARS